MIYSFIHFSCEEDRQSKENAFRNSMEELGLEWLSPLYFPPLKVIGNPEAPPAKSLIIRSTSSGSLPPLGLVQSTVFRIMWPTYTHANFYCKSVVGHLPATPSRTDVAVPLYSTMMHVSISGWTPSIRIMNLRCSSIWNIANHINTVPIYFFNLFFFSFVFMHFKIFKATATYVFPDTKRNHVDVGKLYLALFQVPWKQKREE